MRCFRHFVMPILAAVLILLPAPAAQAAGEQTILVGLYYEGNALPSANLQNSEGTGYRFGYLDSNRNFISLGETTQEAITMSLGGRHVQLTAPYSTFAQAAAAAQAVGGFPVWTNGGYYVRIGSYSSQAEAQTAAASLGGTAVTAGGNAVTVSKTGTNEILFQFDGSSGALTVSPGLSSSEKAVTWMKNTQYYGAFQYQRFNGGNLVVSNVLSLEDYIKGVVPKEMSNSWPLEALKAQAVCARTYAKIQLNSGKHRSQGFDLCNATHCQVYGGRNSAGANSDRAVEETRGQCLWYQGSLAEAVYFSSDGGATESSVNVWGGSVPYLKGVADPYEASVADQIGNYYWSKTYTKDDLAKLLRSNGMQCAEIVDFRVTETTATGNVLTVTITDAAGKRWAFSKEKARTFFGLRSQRYTINGSGGNITASGGYTLAGGGTLSSMNGAYAIDGTGGIAPVNGSPYIITSAGTVALTPVPQSTPPSVPSDGTHFTISGSGWGHLVGMSQWGAHAMAKQGFRYDEILRFYYTGIEVR
ncbi:MAG: SpoIID/LytB domain-containing protein [Oscillospiraceae bacterium]|nr:SpoIID/LytB domain-containing protein [Oscillospiraceae bacterium]